MSTVWVLHSHGDPLAELRRFLGSLWTQAGLNGMLVPVREVGGLRVSPRALHDPLELANADPLAPVMTRNCAVELASSSRGRPEATLGAVLHPCEVRALVELAKRDYVDLAHILTVGIDCLATFNAEEYETRARAAGGADGLVRETLRFARQGGILLYRNRSACQMCACPATEAADVTIALFGIPSAEMVLVMAKSAALAGQLRLSEITNGPAPQGLVARRQRMLTSLAGRRGRTRDRLMLGLSGVPTTVSEWIVHLAECRPCQACLEACPICACEHLVRGEWPLQAGEHGVERWLASCSGCGMCEEACPNHLPLAAIVTLIRQRLAVLSGHVSDQSVADPLPRSN